MSHDCIVESCHGCSCRCRLVVGLCYVPSKELTKQDRDHVEKETLLCIIQQLSTQKTRTRKQRNYFLSHVPSKELTKTRKR